MYNITLLSSFHKVVGKCNSDELYKIIEEIQPEIIFEELPYDVFNTVYAAGYIPQSLEALTIKKYLSKYQVKHIPVDTYAKDISSHFYGYDRIATNNKEYLEFFNQIISLVSQHGYSFINSDEHATQLDKLQVWEGNILSEMNDTKLIYQYNLSKELDDKRDVEMLKNIYNYSKQYNYNKGLFICGAEHRKSIIQKISEYERKEELKLNWNFYKS